MDVKHTDGEIERAAGRYRLLTEKLDPNVTQAQDPGDLRAVATAPRRLSATRPICGRPSEARAHGRSWNHIPIALGFPPSGSPVIRSSGAPGSAREDPGDNAINKIVVVNQ